MSDTKLKPLAGDASLERENLIICDACGQIFNDTDPDQRDHHAQPDHKPLLLARHYSLMNMGGSRLPLP